MNHAAADARPIDDWSSLDRDARSRTWAIGGSDSTGVLSFDEFFSTEREGLIRAVTLVVGSPIAAADVVDEALLRAYQRWPELSQRSRPGGWVFRVAVNLGRSRYRRVQRDIKYRWLSLPTPGVDHTAEVAFAERIEDDRLLAAVLTLPIEQRSVLVARILLDFSEAEVAANLGISPGTVKSRLSRALGALRQQVPDLDPALDRYLPSGSPDDDGSRRHAPTLPPQAQSRNTAPQLCVADDSSHESSGDAKGSS